MKVYADLPHGTTIVWVGRSNYSRFIELIESIHLEKGTLQTPGESTEPPLRIKFDPTDRLTYSIQ